MRTSITRVKKFNSTVGKIVMALAFVLMIGGISIAPAFGASHGGSHGGGGGHQGHGGYHGHGGGGYHHSHGHYRGGAVYAPPPVVYDQGPYQSPGISLVFPIVIR